MICSIDKKDIKFKLTDLLENIINNSSEEEVLEIIEYFSFHEKLREILLTQLADSRYLAEIEDCEKLILKIKENAIFNRADKIAEQINNFQSIELYNRALLEWISNHVSGDSILEWDLHKINKHKYSDLPERWKLRDDLYQFLLSENKNG